MPQTSLYKAFSDLRQMLTLNFRRLRVSTESYYKAVVNSERDTVKEQLF